MNKYQSMIFDLAFILSTLENHRVCVIVQTKPQVGSIMDSICQKICEVQGPDKMNEFMEEVTVDMLALEVISGTNKIKFFTTNLVLKGPSPKRIIKPGPQYHYAYIYSPNLSKEDYEELEFQMRLGQHPSIKDVYEEYKYVAG